MKTELKIKGFSAPSLLDIIPTGNDKANNITHRVLTCSRTLFYCFF